MTSRTCAVGCTSGVSDHESTEELWSGANRVGPVRGLVEWWQSWLVGVRKLATCYVRHSGDMQQIGRTRSVATAVLASCGVVGPILFSAAALVAAARRPGYDPIRQTISELAERGSPDAALMRVVFAAFGLLQVAFAVAVARTVPGGRAGARLVALAGFGYLGAGLFPCDPGAPVPPQSATDQLHTLCTGVGLLAAAAAPLAVARQLRGAAGWEQTQRASAASGWVALVLGAATPVFMPRRGAFQRAFLLVTFLWLGTMAGRTVRSAQPTGSAN